VPVPASEAGAHLPGISVPLGIPEPMFAFEDYSLAWRIKSEIWRFRNTLIFLGKFLQISVDRFETAAHWQPRLRPISI
jgi:hypothetical protein